MDNFTKKRIKRPKELIKDVHKGNYSITKREFSKKRAKKTIKFASKTFKEIKCKVDELKVVHNRLFNKTYDE